ncbi:MAG: ZmpA/ZmpB/ZmpC family metallo-endopeptidase-related protein [archaeon]
MQLIRNYRYQINDGKTFLSISQFPQFIIGRNGEEIDLLQEYADVINEDPKTLNKENKIKLNEYNDLIKNFMIKGAIANIILDEIVPMEQLGVIGRNKKIEQAEKNIIKYPRELVWIDGAEKISGTIELPHAKTYDRIYIVTGSKENPIIKFINSFEEEKEIQQTNNPKRPYYIKNLKKNTTTIYINHFSGGAGTQDDPFVINTLQELIDINNNMGAHYQLGNDIDGEDSDFTAIGSWWPMFTGSLDGNGYIISNLNVIGNSGPNGIFGLINNATIKNLGVENINIDGGQSIGTLVGVAQNNSLIENCYCKNSSLSGSLSGGFIGKIDSSTITNCYNYSSDIEVPEWDQGSGFVNDIEGTTSEIINCYCSNSIFGTNGLFDSFCYNNAADIDLSTCYYNIDNELTSNSNANGLTNDEISNSNNFIDWDFTNIWVIITDYPELQTFTGNVAINPIIVTISNVQNIEVDYGTTLNDVLNNLPSTTTIIDSDNIEHIVMLSWDLPIYYNNIPDDYDAIGTFTLPNGVDQSDPEMTLEVKSIVTVLEKVVEKIQIIGINNYQNIIGINPSSIIGL